ncbi:ATP-binding protein [Conexibacter woesei]|uniref:ATP-binding protein n=1 Tax=Conexibacter woesei TaxID=191495 RepID=UPI000417C536|nr:ATP-binding protein [Conexibacter woesei]
MTARAAAREIGLTYTRANLLLGPSGEAMALYRLEPVVYPLLDDGEKWTVQRRLERMVDAIAADFSLWRVCRPIDPDAYVDQVAGLRSPYAPEAWDELLASHREALACGGGREVETFVGVRLEADAPHGFGARLTAEAGRVLAAVPGFGRGSALSQRQLSVLAESEARVHERLAGVIGLRRARTREVQWLLARAPLRGVAAPDLEPHWQPDALVIETDDGEVARFEPLGWDLWRLPAAVLCEDPAHPPSLHVEADEQESFQAALCVGALADEPVFPGPAAEVLHAPLDVLNFPVDAVVHARWIGNREALGQVRKRVVDAEQVYRDQLESSTGPAWQADDDRTLAREYEQVLQSGARPPMLYASISLTLGAETRELLERRIERLRTAFGDLPLYRPRGLQERLWFDHLPRTDGGRVGEYVQHVTAQQFGAMVPVATSQIGDDGGLYLGHSIDGLCAPLYFDVTAPSRESKPTAVLVAGPPGAGKSVTAQVIGHGAHCRGSIVVDFDPKPDHGWTRIPGLEDQVDVVELSGEAGQQGRLDPMVIGVPELREELAISYLLELLRDPPASWERAIARAVRDIARQPAPSTRAVIDRLGQLDGAGTEVADALDVLADVGLARLGFGDGRTEPITLKRPILTIRTPGLTLPEPGVARETYTRAERVSVATLSLIAALALALVCEDRAQHKVVILDEAWFLLSSPQGRALINRLLRLARAFNATVVLITQLVGDLDGIDELAGTRMGFGPWQDVLRLVGADAPHHGLDANPAPGVGVIRDLHGRVAPIRIHVPDADLLIAIDTVPSRGSEAAR